MVLWMTHAITNTLVKSDHIALGGGFTGLHLGGYIEL